MNARSLHECLAAVHIKCVGVVPRGLGLGLGLLIRSGETPSPVFPLHAPDMNILQGKSKYRLCDAVRAHKMKTVVFIKVAVIILIYIGKNTSNLPATKR